MLELDQREASSVGRALKAESVTNVMHHVMHHVMHYVMRLDSEECHQRLALRGRECGVPDLAHEYEAVRLGVVVHLVRQGVGE